MVRPTESESDLQNVNNLNDELPVIDNIENRPITENSDPVFTFIQYLIKDRDFESQMTASWGGEDANYFKLVQRAKEAEAPTF